MSSAGALGEWVDVPRLSPQAARLDRSQLSDREATVLALVDGRSTLKEVQASSGLDEGPIIEVLTRLLKRGLIQISKGGAPTGGMVVPGADQADLAILNRAGWVARVPPQPLSIEGDRLLERFDPGAGELEADLDISMEQQKEILCLIHHLPRLDHFELFGVEPGEPRSQLKRGFFAFSKRFHPDRFYGKELGKFAERLQYLFEYASAVNDALARDDEVRSAYARAVAARNAHHTQQGKAAQKARADAESKVRKTRLQAVSDARQARRTGEALARRARSEQAAADRRAQRKVEAELRKAALKEKLASRKEARRGRPTAMPPHMKARAGQAEKYYREAQALIEKDDPVQAANLLRLALELAPNNSAYRSALKEVDEAARTRIAEGHWRRGSAAERVGRMDEAAAALKASVQMWPSTKRQIYVANLLVEQRRDTRDAVELAQKAADTEPENTEALFVLGRACQAAGLGKRAAAVYERLLKIDGGHKEAKKALRGLKWKL